MHVKSVPEMFTLFKNFLFRIKVRHLASDRGAQFLEYALLAALIAIGTSIALYQLKDALIDFFKAIIGIFFR